MSLYSSDRNSSHTSNVRMDYLELAHCMYHISFHTLLESVNGGKDLIGLVCESMEELLVGLER